MENILVNLCSKAKLDRDKGYLEITEYLKHADSEAALQLQRKFNAMLADISAPWETKHGILMGSKAVCQAQFCNEEFSMNLVPIALKLAEDTEFRVRIVAGKQIFLLSLCSEMLMKPVETGYHHS